MKTTLTNTLLAVAIAPLFFASHAAGAVVTWSATATNVDTTNSLQVSSAGTLFAAASASGQFYTTPYTVNGVTFGAFNSNISWGLSNIGGFAPVPAGTDYEKMLTKGSYLVDSASGTSPIVLTGLTSGQTYLIQVWTPYWDTTAYSTRLSDTAPAGPGYNHSSPESSTMQLGLSYAPITNPPQFVTGTFTADVSGVQNIYYYGDSSIGIISAVQLRAVPEPATVALLSLGVLGLVIRHRIRHSAALA